MARTEAIVREVRPGDAEALAASMRSEDAAEARAAAGWNPLEAVIASLRISQVSFAAEVGGVVMAIGGVVTAPRETLLSEPGPSVVWLLTGSAVERNRGAFVRASRRVLAGLLRSFPELVNAVDARYAAALRWARHLGAEVRPAVPWGASGLPFHLVIWRRA